MVWLWFVVAVNDVCLFFIRQSVFNNFSCATHCFLAKASVYNSVGYILHSKVKTLSSIYTSDARYHSIAHHL